MGFKKQKKRKRVIKANSSTDLGVGIGQDQTVALYKGNGNTLFCKLNDGYMGVPCIHFLILYLFFCIHSILTKIF